MSNDYEQWKWQEPGEAWKGAGLYHITLTVPSRDPILGTLVIPADDPNQATVEVLPLGRALLNALWNLPNQHPELQVLHYCLMPDHLHVVLYVRHSMKRGIKSVVQGFWQGTKQIGRAYSYLTLQNSSVVPTVSRTNDFRKLIESKAATLRNTLGDRAYYLLPPVFTEFPYIRPMAQYRQLSATIRYLDMNPVRLATKRLKPGFFCVQTGIEIAGRTYSGVGNIHLLQYSSYSPVHVRSMWVRDAEEHGYNQPLRDYMNGYVLAARQGTILVSPFISKQEQAVMSVLLKENLPFIYLADNGFRDYYKPSDALFDAVAAGRVLILSPWEYDPSKKHISRADCVALNSMAEQICAL